ncbi:MAG: hypothetical protein ACRD2G_05235, partial [Terriglobia bacterium]
MSILGFELPTVIIAAYGAVLSTILGIREFRQNTRRIRVFCETAVAASALGGRWDFVVIKAINNGPRPVTITTAGLQMNNKYCFSQVASNLGRNPLPTKLEFGDMVKFSFDLPEIRKAVSAAEEPKTRRLFLTAAFVRDAEGKRWTSR